MALKHFRTLTPILRAAYHQSKTIRLSIKARLPPVKCYSSTTRGEDTGAVVGQTVVTERRGSVVTVGINRPEVRNAVNQETARRLHEELEAFDSDPDLNVAVLYGRGGNFCAGYDLKELANHTASLKLEQDVTKGPGPMGPSRLELSKPLIAAVSGFAVAGGLELALLADLRVVEESAVMGVFCRRFGVPLIDGGTVRLPRLIGLSRALDLILTGRPIGAQEALAYGLANRVVPDGQGLIWMWSSAFMWAREAEWQLAEIQQQKNAAYRDRFTDSPAVSRADQLLPSDVSAGRPLLSHVQLLRRSILPTGHAVRDRPRSSCHPIRICRRCNHVHYWSRKRREILLGCNLQTPREM